MAEHAATRHAGDPGRLGLARGRHADNAVRLAQHADLRPRSGPPARTPSCAPPGCDVGLPDGQMGNSEVGHTEYRRRPRGDAGAAAHRPRGRATAALAALPGAVDADRSAAGSRRHLPPDGPASRPAACIRTRTMPWRWPASWPTPACRSRCTPSPTAATRRRAPAREYVARFAARAAATACGSPPSAAATTPWTATSAGTGCAKAYDAMADGAGPRFADAGAVIDDAYGGNVTDEFIVPAVIGDYRGMRDGDGAAVLQLPRRPRARDARRPARPGLRRLRAATRADQLRRRGRHDPLQRRAGDRFMGVLFPPQTDGRPAGRGGRRAPAARQLAHGGDREISARHLLPERRPRGAVSRARTASWCPRRRSRPTTCSRRCRRRN